MAIVSSAGGHRHAQHSGPTPVFLPSSSTGRRDSPARDVMQTPLRGKSPSVLALTPEKLAAVANSAKAATGERDSSGEIRRVRPMRRVLSTSSVSSRPVSPALPSLSPSTLTSPTDSFTVTAHQATRPNFGPFVRVLLSRPLSSASASLLPSEVEESPTGRRPRRNRGGVYVVEEDEPVSRAFEVMVQHHFSSVPVVCFVLAVL